MEFTGHQATFAYIQTHPVAADLVFPLLCPEREKDWLDGWSYQMIASHSGFVEMGCVFSTPAANGNTAVWLTTEYDKDDNIVEFVRHTPNENVVKINIKVVPLPDTPGSQSFIVYQYTGLNERQNDYIRGALQDDFEKSIKWWELAINHYLMTGTMLRRGMAQ